jgi:hypothetical protein
MRVSGSCTGYGLQIPEQNSPKLFWLAAEDHLRDKTFLTILNMLKLRTYAQDTTKKESQKGHNREKDLNMNQPSRFIMIKSC